MRTGVRCGGGLTGGLKPTFTVPFDPLPETIPSHSSLVRWAQVMEQQGVIERLEVELGLLREAQGNNGSRPPNSAAHYDPEGPAVRVAELEAELAELQVRF